MDASVINQPQSFMSRFAPYYQPQIAAYDMSFWFDLFFLVTRKISSRPYCCENFQLSSSEHAENSTVFEHHSFSIEN